jgi:predicted unusual protein kinase regulating ubiquinone biosynthesis (AarF/ABC1/UbiB family)
MKTLDSIPTSKIERAAKLLTTGAKVGVNYIKYYGEKLTGNEEIAKEKLNQNNASDIYNGLKEMKGSALKVAQMLSMEKNILPKAYVEQFSLAQFSVPPLSAPLVAKTFMKYFDKKPTDLFDTFTPNAVHAASIGQVHQATLKGKKYAVKIQYPGVSDSISSDLAMVKPIALKMFNIKGKDSEQYFKEVENKLKEETDYINELEIGTYFYEKCKHIQNLRFPKYYSEFSNDKIITMDWMEGKHLSEFTNNNTNELLSNTIGQTLWDFYMYQIHVLKQVHADPHPGNFLISKKNEMIVLDFGCIKIIPDDFYIPYFELAKNEIINDKIIFEQKLYELEILRTDDTNEEKVFFKSLFYELLSLFTQPFNSEIFDFSSDEFFDKIAVLAEKYAKSRELRKMNGNRGSRHFIYINRTFFGLYNLMHDIKGKNIVIDNYKKYI